VTRADLLVLACVAVCALVGARRGLVVQVLSLAGFVAGALIGSRLAPGLVGDDSTWVPLAGLAGALAGGMLLQGVGGIAAGALRRRMHAGPLRVADVAGGVLAGAGLAVAGAWIAAAIAVQLPSLQLRREVQRSAILPALLDRVRPEDVMAALARYDHLPLLPALPSGLDAPDHRVPDAGPVGTAAASVVRVVGEACGVGVVGSGWPVRPGIVATNAHVVAGQDEPAVEWDGDLHAATPVYVSIADDVALLRVDELGAAPLDASGSPRRERRAFLIGHPDSGPLTVSPATAGAPATIIAPDASGRRVGPRTVVPLRGRLRPGHSGGPVVSVRGRVVAMMFAASGGGAGGFGVPVERVLDGLDRMRGRADTGPCTR
jgi:hypothetical protein